MYVVKFQVYSPSAQTERDLWVAFVDNAVYGPFKDTKEALGYAAETVKARLAWRKLPCDIKYQGTRSLSCEIPEGEYWATVSEIIEP